MPAMSACTRAKAVRLVGFDVVLDMVLVLLSEGAPSPLLAIPRARSRADVPGFFVSLPSMRHSDADSKFAASEQEIVIALVDSCQVRETIGVNRGRESGEKRNVSRAHGQGPQRRRPMRLTASHVSLGLAGTSRWVAGD